MTVAELIEKLKALPQDLPVYSWDFEGNIGDAEDVVIEKHYRQGVDSDVVVIL